MQLFSLNLRLWPGGALSTCRIRSSLQIDEISSVNRTCGDMSFLGLGSGFRFASQSPVLLILEYTEDE